MSSPKISVCITLMNRHDFMVGKLLELRTMNYDPKLLEICITDGGSTDGLLALLKQEAHHFGQIKYALSSRSALPFKIPENNPACDVNAQISNVASHEIIIRTDAEARFIHPDTIQMIADTLTKEPDLCMSFHCHHMGENFVYPRDMHEMTQHQVAFSKMSFICSVFTRTHFIFNRGVHEPYALGFAAEDSYFHNWWKKNRKFRYPPKGHNVLHLWHGGWQSETRLKLKHDYTMPLYKQMLKDNETPNKGNDAWKRPEMISNVQVFK